MTRWLETDSLSNQDISSALAIGAYIADADRLILVQFLADQVAGNGDYEFYLTLRVNGAGSSYRLIPITTAAAASGVTAIGGQSGMIAVRSGDVLTVYLDGLAGDNSTPDTTVRWFELAALRPATADRTLEVSADGAAAIDWASIDNSDAEVDLSGTTIKNVTDIETDTADIQNRIPAELIAGRMNASVGEMAANVFTAAALAADAGVEIADAVRTELAVELAHLDADVSTAGGLTAQETANAVHNLLPVGTPATGSIGAKINLIDTNVDAIKAVTDALDVSAVTQVAASNAGHLTITVGLTFDEGVTGLTIPADWVTALWTLKNNARDADTAAIVQLRATNPAAGTDGLQRLNGAALVAPITADDGALTVTQATGRIDVYLTDDMTAQLAAVTTIGWDVKFIDEAGDSSGQRGTADVVLTETRATT